MLSITLIEKKNSVAVQCVLPKWSGLQKSHKGIYAAHTLETHQTT